MLVEGPGIVSRATVRQVERGAARGRDEVDPGAGCGGPAEGLLLALALWYTRRGVNLLPP